MDQWLEDFLSPYHERKSLRWSVRRDSPGFLGTQQAREHVWDGDTCLMTWESVANSPKVRDFSVTLNSACFGLDHMDAAVFSPVLGGEPHVYSRLIVCRQSGRPDYVNLQGMTLPWLDHPLAPKFQGQALVVHPYRAGVGVCDTAKRLLVSTHDVWKDSDLALNISKWLEVHVDPTDPAVPPAILVALTSSL